MNYHRLSVRLALFSLLTVGATSSLFAQANEPPSSQFGVGIYSIRSSTPSGLEGMYAFSPNLQAGAELSLNVANTGGFNTTTFLFGPFARILFPTSVSPFIQVGLQVLSTSGSSSVTVGGNTQTVSNSNTTTGLFLGGGVAYNINKEIGLHAGVDVVNVTFGSGGTTQFGWSIIRADADWFF